LAIQIEDVVIAEDDVEARRCQGSPTILIAGLDVEPAARGQANFGVT
jgi:hypothetical protein